ncbi:hypothetical protein C8F04DRAFT_1306990 [Mycena alexandri]|uniref:Uncharacterized protein n=1 Tax=Mycena alexandri TaxID=1745969 RepID=A0AAD6WS37_9AGAR|nr:hypothetical protein C8F04DRAFT_1306990 [Mycena alexandri]
MNYVVESSIFQEASFQMTLYGVNACVELVCYGIYVSLFVLAIHILARRKAAGNKLLVLYTCTVAIFGTAQAVLCLAQTAQIVRFVVVLVEEDTASSDVTSPNLLKLRATAASLAMGQQLIFAGNNLLADSLFVEFVSLFCDLGVPVETNRFTWDANDFHLRRAAPPYSNFRVTDSSVQELDSLSAPGGRIWWIRRDALRVGTAKELLSRYNMAIAMILESGAFYAMVVTAIIITAPTAANYTFVLPGIAMNVVSIAPTMIIVRVGLGHNVQDIVDNRRRDLPLTPLQG